MTDIWFNVSELNQVDEALSAVRAHELFALVHKDPYSLRALQKPRGYAGDAVMMDYVYSGIAPADTCELGRNVFAGTTRGSMGLSVQFRRNLLTAHINEVVSSRADFRILSVASGHCREIENSLLSDATFASSGRFTAFDQDEQSCDTVRKDYASLPVDVVCDSVRSLIAGGRALGKFDLVYSAGLFDYLTDPVAMKLLDSLRAMVKPGGKLLVGNFAPTCCGRGYMELFLDWKLIYRDAMQLSRLFGQEQQSQIKSFLDPHGNVVYAEWVCSS